MDGGILSNFNNAFGDELPFLRADYEAIKQIALLNYVRILFIRFISDSK